MEALAAGLGLVLSEWATANLDTTKKFISVISEKRIRDIDFVESEIIKNRQYALQHRKEIREYALTLSSANVVNQYYLPSVRKVIAEFSGRNSDRFKSVPLRLLAFRGCLKLCKGPSTIYRRIAFGNR
jgi:hypothetical protein